MITSTAEDVFLRLLLSLMYTAVAGKRTKVARPTDVSIGCSDHPGKLDDTG